MIYLEVQIRKIILNTLFCIMPLITLASGENTTFAPVHIDGNNTSLFNQEYPNKSLNMYSIIYGNPKDQFPTNSFAWPGYDSLFHMYVSANMGSEIGDLLLNTYDNVYGENRDHYTRLLSSVSLPNRLLDLYFSYQYQDTYSDRFDKLWSKFAANDSLGRSMKFFEVGLAHEIATGITLNSPFTTVTLQTMNYKRWGTTPFYFSPIYSTGYQLRPSAFFKINESDLRVNFLFNYHKDYYDHLDYIEYTDEGWDVTLKRTLQNGVIAQLSHHNRTELTPETHARALLLDTIPGFLIWKLTGKLYGNMRPGGAVNLSYTQIPKVIFNVNSAWDYVQETRNYTFLENSTPVKYTSKKFDFNTAHASLQYLDTLLFPVNASIWVDYHNRPLWEIIDSTGDTVFIHQDTIDDAALLTCGGRGSYKVAYKKFSTTLWGNFSINPTTKKLRFEIPWNAGLDIAWGKPDNDSLYAALNIESRGPTTLRYFNASSDTSDAFLTYKSLSQTGITCKVKIPFKMPFLRKHLRTNVQIEAGPIHPFNKRTRLTEHPLGNPIGPAISLGLNGFFN